MIESQEPRRGTTSAPRARGSVAPRDLVRLTILFVLAMGPLSGGAVFDPAAIPLLAVMYLAGLLSWARGHWGRAHGEAIPRFPVLRPVLALHALVLFQLVPLPPGLLRWLSPGSFAFREELALLPVTSWAPVSVNPAATLRGLLFLAGMTLFAAAVFREFEEPRWRRRLLGLVVTMGLALSLEALFQAASAEPTKIYGLWKPAEDWGVFGPYVNRANFAGYLVMAIPLALGFAAQALQDVRRSWSRRRVGWLALGEAAGSATLFRSAVAVAVIVGLMASESRGALMAFVLSMAAIPLALRRRSVAALVLVVAAIGVSWVGLSGFAVAFEARGIKASRLDLWADALQIVPHFPVLGVGLNAFGAAYPRYQTFSKGLWWGELHNEYLQSAVDMGLIGAALAGIVLTRLYGAALRGARRGALEAALLGALLASAFSNVVESNWQVPGNAATFAALAGLALRAGLDVPKLEAP
jgi:O-antigen ligase